MHVPKVKHLIEVLFLGVIVSMSIAVPAFGGTITVDEHGVILIDSVVKSGTLKPDPGPGGLLSVCTYPLPFAGVEGDVKLFDADAHTFLDVVRFNGNGTLLFYSDNVDGFDALCDTVSPPGAFYTNTLTIDELGTEAENGAFYTPLSGQPGFDLSGPTYHFISDGHVPVATVPEPTTLALTGTGLLGLAAFRRRRRMEI
jgi:hypothetical protein